MKKQYNEYIETDAGLLTIKEYLDMQAYKMGFNSYEEMSECGFIIVINEDNVIYLS